MATTSSSAVQLYTRQHVWIRLSKKTQRCLVGITRTGVSMLDSEVARVRLPAVGSYLDSRRPPDREPDYQRLKRGAALREAEAEAELRFRSGISGSTLDQQRVMARRNRDLSQVGVRPPWATANAAAYRQRPNLAREKLACERRSQWLDALLDSPEELEAAVAKDRETASGFVSDFKNNYTEGEDSLRAGRTGGSTRGVKSVDVLSHECSSPFVLLEGLYAEATLRVPLSGRVVAVNQRLTDSPWLVSHHPEDQGWLCELQLEDIPNHLYAVWKTPAKQRTRERFGACVVPGPEGRSLYDHDSAEEIMNCAELQAAITADQSDGFSFPDTTSAPHTEAQLLRENHDTRHDKQLQPESAARGSEFLLRRDYVAFVQQQAQHDGVLAASSNTSARTRGDGAHAGKNIMTRSKENLMLQHLPPESWPAAQFLSAVEAEELLARDDADVCNFLRRELCLSGITEWETLLVFPPEVDSYQRDRLHRLARQLQISSATQEDTRTDVSWPRVVMMRLQDENTTIDATRRDVRQ
ncbi:unnamed protein product [Amoebophrya sp. A120]|nr:unnamed protein product [Amoebophrya sp. A120]|eukprot:GSA120T00021729001.1